MSTRPTPVLEVAVFTVRAPDAFPAIQHQTHDALATLSGHRAGLRLRGMTAGLFAGWEDLEAHKRVVAALQARGDLAAFFPGIGEIKVFELFSVLG